MLIPLLCLCYPEQGATAVAAAVNSLASSINVACLQFRPLEDVLCIGHSHGISTIVVPGTLYDNHNVSLIYRKLFTRICIILYILCFFLPNACAYYHIVSYRIDSKIQ